MQRIHTIVRHLSTRKLLSFINTTTSGSFQTWQHSYNSLCTRVSHTDTSVLCRKAIILSGDRGEKGVDVLQLHNGIPPGLSTVLLTAKFHVHSSDDRCRLIDNLR